MDVSQVDHSAQSGQGVIEFLLFLPVFVVFTVVLFKINMVIQVSIVNQQYTRTQALFLVQNHSTYPRRDRMLRFADAGIQQIVTGLSDNKPTTGPASIISDVLYQPESTKLNIAPQVTVDNNITTPDNKEPAQTFVIRVRTTVTLCTPVFFVGPGDPIIPFDGPSPLNDLSNLDFCTRGDINYL